MNPSRQHLGSAEDRPRPLYFNKPGDDLRTHVQMYPKPLSTGKEQCQCMNTAGNTMCNGCRNTTPENNWKDEHSSNVDYRLRDNKATLQESAIYGHSYQPQYSKKLNVDLMNSKPYWPQNKPTYTDDLVITNKKLAMPTHLERNKPPLVTSNNYPMETNYHYEEQSQLRQRATDAYYKDRYNYDEKYQHLKDDSPGINTKMGYMPVAPASTSIYNVNNQQNAAIKLESSRSAIIDHQSNVVNPSNMLAAKDQQPSPNYARKCPPIFSNVEHNSCHSNLYVSPPQFSSEKFTSSGTQHKVYQQSPLQDYRSYDNPNKLSHLQHHHNAESVKHRGSPMQTSTIIAPYHPSNQNSFTPKSEQLSPEGPRQSPYEVSKGNGDYFKPQISKVDAPEMSPIILKQTHTRYQYSKSPIPQPSSQVMRQNCTSRLVEDNMKKEDVFEMHTSGVASNRNIYINPYNPSPKSSDSCCTERSSPYASKATSLCEEAASHSYANYNKISMTTMTANKAGAVNVNVNVNMNINTPHHHPQQQQNQQQNTTSMYRNPAPYFNYESQNMRYERNAHNLSSPALATTSSRPLSATSQTQQQKQQQLAPMHHSMFTQHPPQLQTQNQQQHHMQHMEQYSSLQQQQQQHQHNDPSRMVVTSATNVRIHDTSRPSTQYNIGDFDAHEQQQNPSRNPRINQIGMHKIQAISSTQQPSMSMPPMTIAPTPIATIQLSSTSQSTNKKAQSNRPNYRELINHAFAIRNATSEEELNLQIIKKTLNVDAQMIRPPPNNSVAQLPTQSSKQTSIVPMPVSVPAVLKTPPIDKLHYASTPTSTIRYTQEVPVNRPQVSNIPLSTAGPKQSPSVRYVEQNVNRSDLPLPISDISSEFKPHKLQEIKQEEKVATFSPLDLSMRTIKTKADSTEYPQQNNPLTITQNIESKYSLPRVNFTPNFSLHTNDRQAVTEKIMRNFAVKQENCLEESSIHFDTQFSAQQKGLTAIRNFSTNCSSVGSQNLLPYEQKMQATAAPTLSHSTVQNNSGPRNSTAVVPLPIEIKSTSLPAKPPISNFGQGVFQSRPSVLEANPFANQKVQKKETKNIYFPNNILAAEQLPPDTSIMPLPKIKYEVNTPNVSVGISGNDVINSTAQPAQTAYSIACERNPNFLGRKRHLHEYTSMKYNEPVKKQARYQTEPPSSPSSSLMLSSENSEILKNKEYKSPLPVAAENSKKDETHMATNVASVNSNKSPSNIVLCKKEPITPTAEAMPSGSTVIKSETTSLIAARIRTKAELKGFTFNATPIEAPNTSITEDVKIKLEPLQKECIEIAPLAFGMADENEGDGMLDFNFSNTCNDFVEQLLTNANKRNTVKRKAQLPVAPKLEISDDDLPVSTIEMKTNTVIVSTEFQRLNDDSQNCSISGHVGNISAIDLELKQPTCNLEANDSAITLKSISQDTVYMPNVIQKKISKLEREKMRLHQEKRIAARLLKESSSESESEVSKRINERLKKPLKKGSKSRSAATAEKKHFSDCGSDSSTDIECKETVAPTATKSTKLNSNIILSEEVQEKCKGISSTTAPKEQEFLSPSNDNVIEAKDNEIEKKKEKEHVNIVSNRTKTIVLKDAADVGSTEAESEKEDLATKVVQPIVSKRQQVMDHVSNKVQYASSSNKNDNSSSSSNMLGKEIGNKQKLHSKMIGLNTMTRSKRKRELELQLANSKVLRNDKVVRNDKVIRNSTTTIIKRKYERKFGSKTTPISTNTIKDSTSKETDQDFMSTRLRSKNEKHFTITTRGKKNNILTKSKVVYNKKKLDVSGSSSTNKEHQADMFLEVYRYKRALKVPPSLINIKHPSNQRISASLPDLEKSAEEQQQQTASATNRKCTKTPKVKVSASTRVPSPKQSCTATQVGNEPKSIIDLLHSRVIKSNVRPKVKPVKVNTSNSSLLSHSETSQTTESNSVSELLPTPKKETPESISEGKKRHFSIFDTKVLQTKTRTESKLQQKKEIIREIFVGDDRPASAPPEMTQAVDGGEKMTYEQKYEQFLQQMNIVINEEKLRNFGKSTSFKTTLATTTTSTTVADTDSVAAASAKVKKDSDPLGGTSIKQEEDTESVIAFDADEKLDHDQHHDNVSTISGTSCFRRRKPGKYLRRKGSSGFDYIRKKKKPMPVSSSQSNNVTPVSVKLERLDEEYYGKMKTESDVSREIQKWVLNKGVGQSTLHKAARLGYIDVIVYCLDNMGLNPDQKDNAGYTALHEACTNGWLDIARILLQYGANHSEAAHSGIRPLHEACENDHVEIVRMLLSYGADPLLATYSGQTPLMLASSNSIKEMIENHLQDVQAVSKDRKPWHFNGPWDIYDENQCGFDVLGGAPPCDISRAFRKCNQMSNKKSTQKFTDDSSNAFPNCTVQLNKIDQFNSVRALSATKDVENIKTASISEQAELSIESSNSDGEMFEFEEADVLLPPLYLLKDEGTEKWVLLSDLCNLLKVKSKDTLLNKIYPSTAIPSAHKSLMRELKMSDFLEKATCLQLLCAGEKINVCASKVVLIKYNDNVRNLLGVKTILMKF